MKTLRHLTPIMSPLVEGPAAEKMAKIVAASGLKTLDPKAKMPDELRDKLGMRLRWFLFSFCN